MIGESKGNSARDSFPTKMKNIYVTRRQAIQFREAQNELVKATHRLLITRMDLTLCGVGTFGITNEHKKLVKIQEQLEKMNARLFKLSENAMRNSPSSEAAA